MILVTGGAGFIGSNFVLNWLSTQNEGLINLDSLSYAADLNNLESISENKEYFFIKGSIEDQNLIEKILEKYNPRAVINFAAETHVDRSIENPEIFMKTNIFGTFHLLNASLKFWKKISLDDQKKFKFLHISTDEVFGSLSLEDEKSNELSPYKPNSPYSASKAASDHLVRAWGETYKLPVITTNCTNNYGPHQFPEKLIPLLIHNCLNNKKLPIYGKGENVRDWLYVEDHCEAIKEVLVKGSIGETYNIGGNNEKTNIEIVKTVCSTLDEIKPRKNNSSYKELITFVEDRPGHDFRYSLDISKIKKELNWQPQETFESGIRKTILWYLENMNDINPE
jgi:dTDP-glucose 4,6-dehydratase|tara:strand:+ start:210 stop:1223 length:1014 start_codon:yes stop_codon:yes gene_type:complete